MKHRVDYNVDFNNDIKKHIFTFSILFTTPSDYLRQIFMTCGSGYEYDPSSGEIVNIDDIEYETEMKYPEVSEYVVETMIRDTNLKFVEANIDKVIEEYDELRGLDGRSPVEMYVQSWTKSTLFFKMAKLVLHDPASTKVMTDKTLAALSMFCNWVVSRSQRSGIVYKPDCEKTFKPHNSYNVPDGFAEFVTATSLVYDVLDSEYNERHNIEDDRNALASVLEILYNADKDNRGEDYEK